MKKAANAIVMKCIDVSFEGGGADTNTQIRLAVDDLIRNFEADPDRKVDLGGLKATTPRTALETVVTFLEDEGLNGEQCDEAAADQVHTALARR